MITAGRLLQETRQRKQLTLNEVASGTKIKPSFLSAIEKGEYSKLPSPSYALGFVKNYAEFLGISAREIVPLFKREFDANNAYKVLPKGFTEEQKPLSFRGLRLRRTIVASIGVLFCIFLYLFYQYRAAFFPPSLTISKPTEGSTTSQDISVIGETDPSASVFVNNEQVSVDDEGEFQKSLTLFSGKNAIVIKARNTFGKETIVERNVIVKE